MGWDVSKPSFFGTKPTTSVSTTSGQSSGGAQPRAYDLTGEKKSGGDSFTSRVQGETNQYKADFQTELQQQFAAKQQEQARMTAVRDGLKKKMDDIKAERSRISDPEYDRQKLTDLDAQESQAKSEDRLAYFEMGNNYQTMLSNSLSQTKFVS